MIGAELDHIIIAANSLQRGADYVQGLLGAPLQPGGRHLTQGTHNMLLRLGDTQYLEVIAIDPEGVKPGSPRWFELDEPGLQSDIADAPRLITWAARVPDIDQVVRIPPYDGCEVQDLSRGDLRWRVALDPAGRLPEAGVLPLVIKWQVEFIPPKRLPDSGCAIRNVTIRHPQPQSIDQKLKAMRLVSSIAIRRGDRPRLAVSLDTPNGPVELSS